MAAARRRSTRKASSRKTTSARGKAASSAATSAAAPPTEVALEDLVAGRVALRAIEAQLDQQADALRAQLAINRSHRRETEETLKKLDAKLAKQDPLLFKLL
jgi:hypothetical protein